MTTKRTFFICFFLMFFVIQQVHADSSIRQAVLEVSEPGSARATGLPPQLTVTMLRLNSDGSPVRDAHGRTFLCDVQPPDSSFGCTEPNVYGQNYPYGSNPVTVSVEADYLVNVLPREMDVITHSPPINALKAQSLAARSEADWKYRANHSRIDNSRDNQVFVPHSFEYYTQSIPLNSPADPCNENGGYNTLNPWQQSICSGVDGTHGQYVSYQGASIDAAFGSDMRDQTITEPVRHPKDYLKGVPDPVSSSACGAVTNSNGYGLSQKGAMRWIRGSQCASQADEAAYGVHPWSLQWSDYRQILVHYYTKVDLLNASGTSIAPNDRWNLLDIQQLPSQLVASQVYITNFQVQNTSTSDWSSVILGYQWTPVGTPAQPASWVEAGATPAIMAGDAPTLFNVPIKAPVFSGTYALHMDLKRPGGNWFMYGPNGGWPDAIVMPIDVTGGATPFSATISQGSDDASINPLVSCVYSTQYNEIYIGHCYTGEDIVAGFRFNSIPIACDTPIQTAYVVFTTDGPFATQFTEQIYGELSPNSATFSYSDTPAYRPTTSHSASWTILDPWELGYKRQTPELKDIIQEVTACSNDWAAGNSLSIIMKNATPNNIGRRVIGYERWLFQSQWQPAQLVIGYTP